jgi:hypothetical protein
MRLEDVKYVERIGRHLVEPVLVSGIGSTSLHYTRTAMLRHGMATGGSTTGRAFRDAVLLVAPTTPSF